jgi:carboxylesterase
MGVLFTGAAAYAGYRLWRIEPPRVEYIPNPARDYDDAMARLAVLRAREGDRVNPVCRTRALTHGHRTPQAIAFFHGMTSCPQQFQQLAEDLHGAGCNVLLPRLPRHGLDRLSTAQADLTLEELIATAQSNVDILHGLGEEITVLGLSAGGALAAWCAQNRADLDRAICVSPALGFPGVPPRTDRLFANGLAMSPNFFQWWDSDLKEAIPNPPYAYPRIASHAVAVMLRLGQVMAIQSRRNPPGAGSILVVLNPSDEVVRNECALQLVANWRRHGAQVEVFEFPAEWGLPHDLIDPAHPEQQVAKVYPLLEEMIVKRKT